MSTLSICLNICLSVCPLRTYVSSVCPFIYQTVSLCQSLTLKGGDSLFYIAHAVCFMDLWVVSLLCAVKSYVVWIKARDSTSLPEEQYECLRVKISSISLPSLCHWWFLCVASPMHSSHTYFIYSDRYTAKNKICMKGKTQHRRRTRETPSPCIAIDDNKECGQTSWKVNIYAD